VRVARRRGAPLGPAAALLEALSALDRAAKAGAIHPNAAARRKSRLTIKVNAAMGGSALQSGGRVVKTTGKAAAAKAAKARIAAGKADKAKGAQTAAGKARAALSKTARAEAAAAKARDEGLRVAVIPTRASVQAIAALAVHDGSRRFEDDVVAMTAAAGHCRHGGVTVAARAAVTMGGVCKPGDVLGIVDGDFAVIGDDLVEVAGTVLDRMLGSGGELVTLVRGADADAGLADAVASRVHSVRPEVDTVVYEGGQSRYPLLIGVE